MTWLLRVPGSRDGAASFVLLRFDDETSTATNVSEPTLLDAGSPDYGTLSSPGGTARDGAAGDGRTLHVSWLRGAPHVRPACAPPSSLLRRMLRSSLLRS